MTEKQRLYNKEYRKKNNIKLNEYNRRYYELNKEKLIKISRDNYQKNKEKLKETNKFRCKKWVENNKELKKSLDREYYKKNRQEIIVKQTEYKRKNRKKYNALNKKREAAKLNQTPKWADLKAIEEFYKNCPDGYHVDHIIPLQGKHVRGLHIIENLQYLLAVDNMKKGNRIK